MQERTPSFLIPFSPLPALPATSSQRPRGTRCCGSSPRPPVFAGSRQAEEKAGGKSLACRLPSEICTEEEDCRDPDASASKSRPGLTPVTQGPRTPHLVTAHLPTLTRGCPSASSRATRQSCDFQLCTTRCLYRET